MSTIEELPERKSSSSGIENREYGSKDLSRWPHGIVCQQKLPLTPLCYWIIEDSFLPCSGIVLWKRNVLVPNVCEIGVFCVVVCCNLVHWYHWFGGTYCPNLQGWNVHAEQWTCSWTYAFELLNMETLCCSEMSVYAHKATGAAIRRQLFKLVFRNLVRFVEETKCYFLYSISSVPL
jgi:hypothetical protein